MFYDWHNFGIGDCTENSGRVSVTERVISTLTVAIDLHYHNDVKRGIVKMKACYICGHGSSEPLFSQRTEISGSRSAKRVRHSLWL